MAGESYSVKVGVSASGVEKAISQLTELDSLLNKVNGMSASISVAFQDNATEKLKDIEDAVSKLNSLSANASATLEDNATNQIKDVQDAIGSLSGSTALVSVSAEDNATNQLMDVQDQISALNGSTATINIEGQVAGAGGGGNGGFDGGNLFYSAFGNDNQYNSFKNGYNATNKAGSGIMNMANNFTSSAMRYGGKATALIGGVGLGRIMSDYANWEYQQATTEGVLDPSERTPENLANLNAISKQYANKGYSAYGVGQAQTELAKAGFNSQEIPDMLPAVMNISNSEGLDIDTSTLIASSVLRSFSLQAKDANHVADLLAKTANATSSDIFGLGESIKYSGAMANSLGISVESTSAALGVLSNYNIRGSQAGTTLRSAMSRIITPTKNAKAIMDKYNMSFIDGEGNMKNFADIIDILNSGLGDLTSSEKAAAIKDMFGQTAVAGMLSLMNAGGKQVRDLTDSLYNADGTAQEMADIKLDTLLGQWKIFKAEVSNTAIEIGEKLSPMAIEFLDYLKGKLPDIKDKIVTVAQFLSDHSTQVGQFASGMVKVGAALMALSAVGKVTSAITNIGSFISSITGVSGLAGFAAAINPVAAGIGALAGAFVYLYKHSTGFKFDFDNKFSETVQSINELKESFKGLSEIDFGPLETIGSVLGNVFGDTIITGLDTVKTTIDGVKESFEGLKQIWDQGFGLDGEAGAGRSEGFMGAVKGFWKLTHPFENSLANEGKKVKNWLQSDDSEITAASQTENTTEEVTKHVTIEVTENGTDEVKSKIEEIQGLVNTITDNGSVDLSTGAASNIEQYQNLINIMQQLPQGIDLSTQITGTDDMVSQLQQVKDYADQLSSVSADVTVNENGIDDVSSGVENLTGAIEGIPTSHDTSITCSGAETAASEASSVAAAVNSIPTSKTVTINVSKVGSGDVAENATGTKFYNDDLTTVAENGYEIVSFGKGTQIFSHGDSKSILNDYYKNQASLAKAAGAENYQVNKSSNNGNVTYLTFQIQGGNTKEIVNKVASELTAALVSKSN